MMLSPRCLSLLVLLTFPAEQVDPSKQARILIEKLRSDKVEEREEAARNLKGLGKEAVPELEKATQDKDAEVASRARRLLSVISLIQKLTFTLLRTFPGVEERLVDGDEHTYAEVFLEATKSEGGRAIYPALKEVDLEALAPTAIRGASTSEEKKAVCMGLGAWKVRTAVPELLKLLHHEDPQLRESAVTAIGYIRVESTFSEVLRLFDDNDGYVRRSAVTALPNVDRKKSIPHIVGLLTHKDAGMRAQAARFLGNMQVKVAIPEIVKLLSDGDSTCRRNAAEALAYLDAYEAVPELMKLLRDTEAIVRSRAAFAIGELRGKEGVPEISHLLVDQDLYVRSEAVTALGKIGAADQAARIAGLLDDEYTSLRLSSLGVLVDLRATSEVPRIAKLLTDGESSVRLGAASALSRLGAKEGIPELVKLLKDPNADMRFSAASSLCVLGYRDGVPMLLEDTRDLGVLNALRRQEDWIRLHEKTVPVSLEGKVKQMIEELAKNAGLTVDWPASFSNQEPWWIAQHLKLRYRVWTERAPILVGVRRLIDPEHTFILDADRIRIIPRDEAVKFWKDWWSQQERQK